DGIKTHYAHKPAPTPIPMVSPPTNPEQQTPPLSSTTSLLEATKAFMQQAHSFNIPPKDN
ncbi:MAG: hypothetical protein ACRCTE_00870, partial [Cellulosilyticaceae bacterium]